MGVLEVIWSCLGYWYSGSREREERPDRHCHRELSSEFLRLLYMLRERMKTSIVLLNLVSKSRLEWNICSKGGKKEKTANVWNRKSTSYDILSLNLDSANSKDKSKNIELGLVWHPILELVTFSLGVGREDAAPSLSPKTKENEKIKGIWRVEK